jgi:hypothetical protein
VIRSKRSTRVRGLAVWEMPASTTILREPWCSSRTMRKANSKMWAVEAPFPRPGRDVARGLGNLLCSGCVIRAHDIQAMLNYPGTPGGGYLTHSQGISGVAPGIYGLSADWSNLSGTIQGASLVTVPRNANASLTTAARRRTVAWLSTRCARRYTLRRHLARIKPTRPR